MKNIKLIRIILVICIILNIPIFLVNDINTIASEQNNFNINSIENDPPLVQLLHPRGGETLNGAVTIKWYAIDDDNPGLYNNLPTYLYYKLDKDDTWIKLDYFLSDTGNYQYQWNTTNLLDSQYMIKVFIVGKNNNFAMDTSDLFKIENGNTPLMVSCVNITDLTINNNYWTKDCDNLRIIANINGFGSEELTINNITADLTGFNLGNNVKADVYDGLNATWILNYVKCNPNNGIIKVKIMIDGHEKNNVTISTDNTPPDLNIYKPKNGLYIFNKKILLPLKRTIIIGAIDFELDINDNFGISKTEFYIDGSLEKTVFGSTNEWHMKKKIIGRHYFEVKIYDYAENYDVESIVIKMFSLYSIE